MLSSYTLSMLHDIRRTSPSSSSSCPTACRTGTRTCSVASPEPKRL